MAEKFWDLLEGERLIAVIRTKDPYEAIEVAERSSRAGLKLIEISLTSKDAYFVLQNILDRIPNVGVGTVVSAEDCIKVIEMGARFLVSPCFSKKVFETSQKYGIPYIPAAMTPTEVYNLRDLGIRYIKLFPASTVGIGHLKALMDVFPDVKFIPTGGIGFDTAGQWLEAGAVAVGLGKHLLSYSEQEIKLGREQILFHGYTHT